MTSSPSSSSIQLVPALLGAIALAGVPLSAWLFVQTYVDDAIDTAVRLEAREVTRTTDQLAREIDQGDDERELLRAYVRNLCTGVRANTSPPLVFECGSTYFRSR